jgi:hypothetical protein
MFNDDTYANVDPSQCVEQLDVVAETSWRQIVRTLEVMLKLTFLRFRTKLSVILDTNYKIITNP